MFRIETSFWSTLDAGNSDSDGSRFSTSNMIVQVLVIVTVIVLVKKESAGPTVELKSRTNLSIESGKMYTFLLVCPTDRRISRTGFEICSQTTPRCWE